jgi:pyridinium-3,5-bisthiocarboxylic acid mononucleotide nickel chelatase
MRAVYFDCFAGVSGDMIIGAQLDLGVDLQSLKEQLSSFDLGGYEIKSSRVERSGIAATKFDVEVDESVQPARTLADIRAIIAGSRVSGNVKSQATRVFERLAVTEALVHGTSPDKVHFHEVGAVDSIIDIAGALIGFELLGVERYCCSQLRVGRGLVETAHGLLPVPAPATAELLRNVPVYSGELEGEFVTPTGAAILTTMCETYGPMPRITVAQVGYGAGSRNPKGFPNVLRLMIGEIEEEDQRRLPEDYKMLESGTKARTKVYARPDETIVVVETNIDDMNPQVYGFVMERAFVLGALDVFITPAQMKKNRPGVLLTVLCGRDIVDSVIDMLLVESTTLGIRYYEAKRRILERVVEMVETEYGPVRLKVARDGGRTLHFQPEYEDCARAALQANVPLLDVQAAATAEYRNRLRRDDKAKS